MYSTSKEESEGLGGRRAMGTPVSRSAIPTAGPGVGKAPRAGREWWKALDIWRPCQWPLPREQGGVLVLGGPISTSQLALIGPLSGCHGGEAGDWHASVPPAWAERAQGLGSRPPRAHGEVAGRSRAAADSARSGVASDGKNGSLLWGWHPALAGSLLFLKPQQWFIGKCGNLYHLHVLVKSVFLLLSFKEACSLCLKLKSWQVQDPYKPSYSEESYKPSYLVRARIVNCKSYVHFSYSCDLHILSDIKM